VAPSPRRPHRLRALALRLALVAALSALALEGLVRGILFEGWFQSVERIARLRAPSNFARPNEDEFYELRVLLRQDQRIPEPNRPDPVLGWTPMAMLPGYDHGSRTKVGDQRPVLLFGDSYAIGVVEERDRFQTLFEETEHADSMELVNYGCGGYGLDQICLLAERALPLWAAQRPLVLMSLLVDDDMDRCRLSMRPWPKPRFRVVDGRLELEREPLPTTAEHMASAFPLAKSWTWRLFLHAGILPERLANRLCGGAAAERRASEVSALLLERIIAELEALDVPFGFVLFHNRTSIYRPASLEWREALVVDTLERHGVPYVSTRRVLAEHMAQDGRPESDYFILQGLGRNHMTRLGNEIAMTEMVELVDRLLSSEVPGRP